MNAEPILSVVFFRTDAGREPVRQWLKNLDATDRKAIGEDIKLVQFRWPLGLPRVRKMEPYLWEIRSNLSEGRIARVLFTIEGSDMALLHGFIKKSQKILPKDLSTARNRRDLWKRGRGQHE